MLLRAHIPSQQILQQNQLRFVQAYMAKHGFSSLMEAQAWLEKSGAPRDYYLNEKDVYNIRVDKVDVLWKLHPDPLISAQLWMDRQPAANQLVLSLQVPKPGTNDHALWERHSQHVAQAGTQAGPAGLAPSDPLPDLSIQLNPANWTPFIMGFTFSDCVKACVRYGNRRPVMMDATHGTNAQKFYLFTLMVIDDHGNGRPVAWFLLSSESAECLTRCLQAFLKRVRTTQAVSTPVIAVW